MADVPMFLFFIYINDLIDQINSIYKIFRVGTSLFPPIHNKLGQYFSARYAL